MEQEFPSLFRCNRVDDRPFPDRSSFGTLHSHSSVEIRPFGSPLLQLRKSTLILQLTKHELELTL